MMTDNISNSTDPAAQPFVAVRNLKKIYVSGGDPLTILDGISLDIREGSVAVVTGESGSGKTTLLNILGGLDVADSGEVHIAGTAVSSLKESRLGEYRRKRLGFIFQFHNLMKDFSALENTALPAMINGHSRRESLDMARDLLDRVGLSGRLENYPHQLSGGERQRVAITRALINDPDLILADEPTGSLDEERSREIEDLLLKLVYDRGKTMLLVTHDAKLAARGDNHFVLSRGVLQ